MKILLATINARYIHSSLALRYLKANMGELETQTQIIEFDLQKRPEDIVEIVLQSGAEIIGFGVYIWNIEHSTKVIAMLKQVKPHIRIILGGPEVSYEYETLEIVDLCDHLIIGPADLAFGHLCHSLQNHETADKIINPQAVRPEAIRLPYYLYSTEDIANRVIYVEASRGCPFKCEFCLSALDKTSQAFELDGLLQELDTLYAKGARQFKFIDRTFNLSIANCSKILRFFLDKDDPGVFVHFELIPDRLPEELKSLISRFAPGAIQFEIGIQSFNPEVQARISRKQDNEKSLENLRWLIQHSQAHLHTDLIIGLPGETLESIASGFNLLCQLRPQEIQVGILKRLRGTPIVRHSQSWTLQFNPKPPYNLLQSATLNFTTMQSLNRFARYWDLVGNSGRFKSSLLVLLDQDPFSNFMQFSNYVFAQTSQTHKISLKRLFELLAEFFHKVRALPPEQYLNNLETDYMNSRLKSLPEFMDKKRFNSLKKQHEPQNKNSSAIRQARHIA